MINKRNVESRFDEAAFNKSQENSKWSQKMEKKVLYLIQKHQLMK